MKYFYAPRPATPPRPQNFTYAPTESKRLKRDARYRLETLARKFAN